MQSTPLVISDAQHSTARLCIAHLSYKQHVCPSVCPSHASTESRRM